MAPHPSPTSLVLASLCLCLSLKWERQTDTTSQRSWEGKEAPDGKWTALRGMYAHVRGFALLSHTRRLAVPWPKGLRPKTEASKINVGLKEHA